MIGSTLFEEAELRGDLTAPNIKERVAQTRCPASRR
jgi:hypothetical protein